jgi:hypothetical protein
MAQVELSGSHGSAVLEEQNVTAWAFAEEEAGDARVRPGARTERPAESLSWEHSWCEVAGWATTGILDWFALQYLGVLVKCCDLRGAVTIGARRRSGGSSGRRRRS